MRDGNILKYSDIKNDINNNEISPVYLFLGEEKYLKQEIIFLIKKKIIPEGFGDDFNFNHFYSSDTDLSKIIDVCNTLPAFAERRMVVADNIDKFKKAKILEDYIKFPSESTCLILNTDERTLKGIKTVSKYIKKVIFYPLFDNQLIQWSINKVKKEKKELTLEAAQKLINLCDNTLLEINNELEKLLIYCKDKEKINIKDVEDLIGDIKGYDVFKLIDAIFSHNYGLSLKIFKKQIESGLNLYSVFALLNKSIHDIFQIKYFLEIKKMRSDDIIKEIKINPFRYKNIVKNIKKYDIDNFFYIINVLFKFDYKFKSYTSMHKDRLFEDLIYRLCTN